MRKTNFFSASRRTLLRRFTDIGRGASWAGKSGAAAVKTDDMGKVPDYAL